MNFNIAAGLNDFFASGERGDGLEDERPRFSEAGQILQQKGSPKHKSPPLHSGLTASSGCTTVHGLLPALVSGKQLA